MAHHHRPRSLQHSRWLRQLLRYLSKLSSSPPCEAVERSYRDLRNAHEPSLSHRRNRTMTYRGHTCTPVNLCQSLDRVDADADSRVCKRSRIHRQRWDPLRHHCHRRSMTIASRKDIGWWWTDECPFEIMKSEELTLPELHFTLSISRVINDFVRFRISYTRTSIGFWLEKHWNEFYSQWIEGGICLSAYLLCVYSYLFHQPRFIVSVRRLNSQYHASNTWKEIEWIV